MATKTVTVDLVIGLPGSGKTHLVNGTADVRSVYVVDDIKDMSELPSSIDRPWVISDPNFCNGSTLERAKELIQSRIASINPDAVGIIYCHYFKNDAEQCRKNVRYRNDGREVEATIRKYEKEYNPPYWAMKVWECPE